MSIRKKKKEFKEFLNGFGIDQLPFVTFSTENELQKAEQLFISYGKYDSIVDNFKNRKNIIIRGERGSGKTAILEDFKRICNENKFIYVQIDDFEKLSSDYSNEDLYRFLTSEISVALLAKISNSRLRIWRKLEKEDRIFLSYLLYKYLPEYSLKEIKSKIDKVQISPISDLFVKFINLFRTPINYAGTIGRNVLYEYLIKHYAFLPPIEDEGKIIEFLPELSLKATDEFTERENSFSVLKRVGEITQKLGHEPPTVFIDRIDEDNRFENDAVAISEFMLKILSDSKLLSIVSIQLVIFTWSTPFRFIEDRVRTQKYYCPILEWDNSDLEKALNRRLTVFSLKKDTIVEFRKIFDNKVSKDLIDQIFYLANSNPRDLWHIFKLLFENQYSINSHKSKIGSTAVEKSLEDFVRGFNYYEYYPRKSNANANSMDIYAYSNHLLKLDSEEFTKNALNEKAGTGGSTNNYVVGMERIGLLERQGQESGAAVYKIKDPKIVYALKNGIDIRK